MGGLPRVLIGCPTSEHKRYCLSEYLSALNTIVYQNAEFIIVDNSATDEYFLEIKERLTALNITRRAFLIKDSHLLHAKDRIVHSRNLIRTFCLEQGFDYFLSLEQDVFPEPDIVQQLMQHQKDIVSALVMNYNVKDGKKIVVPMLWQEKPDVPGKIFYISPEKLQNPGLVEVDVCSLSCVLISRKVLENVTFRYEKGFDDMMFCKDAKEQGFRTHADTAARPKHLPGSWNGVVL
ncbi:MAG: hypothetical protein V1743_02820 [Nanoarchaeota archaeon]